jgi:hypothetical protein
MRIERRKRVGCARMEWNLRDEKVGGWIGRGGAFDA